MGGEQLGRRGNVFAFDHLADDVVFLVGDVELIQPADDLNVGPVFLGNGVHQLAQQRVGFGQVAGQQQFACVVQRLKQKRHGRVQRAALGQQQLAVEGFILGAVELEFAHAGGVEPRQVYFQAVVQQLKAALAIRMRQHPPAVVEIALQLHKTDGAQAVEPAIGGLLHRLSEALLLYSAGQRIAGALFGPGQA
ncbi:MAG: hypothetical protein L0I84_08585 [Halomonas subglaciescola]|nr:hypothetical protein [Halomonas subglaciescola]